MHLKLNLNLCSIPLLASLNRVASNKERRYSVVLAVCALLHLAGCQSAPAPAKLKATAPSAFHFPPRPAVTAPPVKLFHLDNDTLTLVTKDTATDDEIAAILWQFKDATQTHSFDALHLPQKFIDARKPTVWFHVYRGAKCASEKYGKGPLPCAASYHGAGDFTLGSYKMPNWNTGVLRHSDNSETPLWNDDQT